MKDREFLLIVSLAIATLIGTNFSLFIKSLGSSELATPEIQEAARQVKIEDFRKNEQKFWSDIKELNFDPPITEESEDEVEKTSDNPEKSDRRSETPNQQPAISPTQAEKPYTRFLFIGDSIMFDLGTALQQILKKSYNISNAKLAYKVSSGLNRIEYYDWYARTIKLIKSSKPDVIVIMFGGNDDGSIRDNRGKYRAVYTDEWKNLYRQKIEKYAKIVSSASVRKVYWIGQPKSSRPRYNKFFNLINQIYSEVAQSYPKIEFISTWETFSIAGKFAPIIADKAGKKRYVKAKDGVHLTPHGSKILTNIIIEKMVEDKILKAQSNQAL